MPPKPTQSNHDPLRPRTYPASPSSSSISPERPLKPRHRHRPTPIRTSNIKPTILRNATAHLGKSGVSVSESAGEDTGTIVPSESPQEAYGLGLVPSPLTSALDTPRAIVTAIPWKLRSRSRVLGVGEEGGTPVSAFSGSSGSELGLESPGYQYSAFRLSPSPVALESAVCLSESVFSMEASSACLYAPSPLLSSAWEGRLRPDLQRDLRVPGLSVGVRTEKKQSGLSTPRSVRKTRTPVLNGRRRQKIEKGAVESPVTPITDEIEVPMILDPMTPPANYTQGTMSSRLLPQSSRESSSSSAVTRSRALKRGRAASRQELRDEVVPSHRITEAPREEVQGDLVFLLPSSVFDPNQAPAAEEMARPRELAVPSKRSRRQRDTDLDGYERLRGRYW
ncbi:hypothetical protein EG328_005293 [Venturia inaequalis]|uniref:Uncharacterized protein n=1 Tax=Venturia inaequalis TaxID=5025 RepID=A0A8H3UMN4_VENIN|nr:hypothetical protein EG328_005293 [Venturia inaequalis]